MRLGQIALSMTLVASLALVVPASAEPAAACAAPVPSPTQPGYTIGDPHCDFGTTTPFAPLTNEKGKQISQVFAGIAGGSAYRIEIPKHWRHELVLYAHGFRGNGTTVWADNP